MAKTTPCRLDESRRSKGQKKTWNFCVASERLRETLRETLAHPRLGLQGDAARAAQAEARVRRQLKARSSGHIPLVVQCEVHRLPLPHGSPAEIIPHTITTMSLPGPRCCPPASPKTRGPLNAKVGMAPSPLNLSLLSACFLFAFCLLSACSCCQATRTSVSSSWGPHSTPASPFKALLALGHCGFEDG